MIFFAPQINLKITMEAKQKEINKDRKVKLVVGEFTPDQALDILNGLIDKKINYHKIEKLKYWEGSHIIDETPYINRILELEEEKKAVNQYISEIKKEGKKLSINGFLTVKPIN